MYKLVLSMININVQKDIPAVHECPLWGSNIILLFKGENK